MKTLQISDVLEDVIYNYQCPYCNEHSESFHEPQINEEIYCEYCKEKYKIINDN